MKDVKPAKKRNKTETTVLRIDGVQHCECPFQSGFLYNIAFSFFGIYAAKALHGTAFQYVNTFPVAVETFWWAALSDVCLQISNRYYRREMKSTTILPEKERHVCFKSISETHGSLFNLQKRSHDEISLSDNEI